VAQRKVWVFFYGSYINLDVLRKAGLVPEIVEIGRLAGFDLIISPRANLVRSDQHAVYGILTQATHRELERLYTEHAQGKLGQLYEPEAVVVEVVAGYLKAAMTYNCSEMKPGTVETAYVDRIYKPAKALGFPEWYLLKIASFYP